MHEKRTVKRAKPSVPFGRKYQIIDFTLTNCLHARLRRLLVLTQYKSHSLQTPPARAVPGISGNEGVFINSILSGGTIISGSNASHSVLFQNVFIDDGSIVENPVLFDNVKVVKNFKLNKCIIDKDVVIPDNERIGYDLEKGRNRFTMTENEIIVVPQGYTFA